MVFLHEKNFERISNARRISRRLREISVYEARAKADTRWLIPKINDVSFDAPRIERVDHVSDLELYSSLDDDRA